jgi:ketosteroid isomerase-like protein
MKAVLVLLALAFSFDAFAQSKKTADQLFTDLETKWMTAWKNKDEAALRKILADDFTLTSSLSTGSLANKEEWVDKALHQYHCKSFVINKLQSRVYDKTAVVNIWFYQSADANGKDWSGNFLLTDVWVQKNKAWQVVARHASWLPNK